MEDEAGLLPLPCFRGRLSQDWSAHEMRVRAWLRVKGIPPNASEARDVLFLSLESESQASLVFERALTNLHTFEEGVSFMKQNFASVPRKQLAQTSAQNALANRSYRCKGHRRELIKDLVADIELLLEKADITKDQSKLLAFTRCFYEYPQAMSCLRLAQSYDDALSIALQWERELIQQENEATYLVSPSRFPSSSPRDTPVTPTATQSPTQPEADTTDPSQMHQYLHIPLDDTFPPPPPRQLFDYNSYVFNASIKSRTRSHSAPSTIDEVTEIIDPTFKIPEKHSRPRSPTPEANSAPILNFPEERSTSPDSWIETDERDSSDNGQADNARTVQTFHTVPDRSSQLFTGGFLSLARPKPKLFERRVTPNFDDEDDHTQVERSRSTPPMTTGALHPDVEDYEERPVSVMLSSGPAAVYTGWGSTNRARKLIKKNSKLRKETDIDTENDTLTGVLIGSLGAEKTITLSDPPASVNSDRALSPFKNVKIGQKPKDIIKSWFKPTLKLRRKAPELQTRSATSLGFSRDNEYASPDSPGRVSMSIDNIGQNPKAVRAM